MANLFDNTLWILLRAFYGMTSQFTRRHVGLLSLVVCTPGNIRNAATSLLHFKDVPPLPYLSSLRSQCSAWHTHLGQSTRAATHAIRNQLELSLDNHYMRLVIRSPKRPPAESVESAMGASETDVLDGNFARTCACLGRQAILRCKGHQG